MISDYDRLAAHVAELEERIDQLAALSAGLVADNTLLSMQLYQLQARYADTAARIPPRRVRTLSRQALQQHIAQVAGYPSPTLVEYQAAAEWFTVTE